MGQQCELLLLSFQTWAVWKQSSSLAAAGLLGDFLGTLLSCLNKNLSSGILVIKHENVFEVLCKLDGSAQTWAIISLTSVPLLFWGIVI